LDFLFNCIHHSSTDTHDELTTVQTLAREAGAFDAIICSHWAQGGAGAVDLAKAVEKACVQPTNFKFLYDLHVCTVV
jgi:methylenetetrahydrofolate dehydrogenase (NADP+)/methenyltetrahydrofolate cyclohydrolase/formyltetrahydrofolate synthetase